MIYVIVYRSLQSNEKILINYCNSKLLEFKPIKIEQINIGSLSNVTIDNFENKIDISKQIDDLNKNFDFCYLNKRAEYLQLKSNFYVEYYAFFQMEICFYVVQ